MLGREKLENTAPEWQHCDIALYLSFYCTVLLSTNTFHQGWTIQVTIFLSGITVFIQILGLFKIFGLDDIQFGCSNV